MRRQIQTAATVAIAVCALVATAPARADAPTRITIVSVFDPITFGDNAYVNGQLIGDAQGGQVVALEQSPPPFTDWTPVAQVAADAYGYYSFKLHPSQTLQYRTSSQGVGSERVVQVSVAPKIVLTAKALGKSTVRYSGRLGPPLPGQALVIQRRASSGSWATVANAPIHVDGSFAGRFTAHRNVQLRAFYASDGAHLSAYSSAVRVVPGRRARSSAATAAAACSAPKIRRITWKPDPPAAGQGTTLRVSAAMSGGKLYAVDVVWGEGDARDHFTLAPGFRKPRVTFALRHRYKAAGSYRLTIRAYGAAGSCRKATSAERPVIQVS